MKLKRILLALSLFFFSGFAQGYAIPVSETDHTVIEESREAHNVDEGHGGHYNHSPHPIAVLPFVLLLGMIATGPLFYEHFWHKRYPLVTILLGTIVVVYYVFALKNTHAPIHALFEYVSFIALVGSLFVISGGILIEADLQSKPIINVGLLVFGAVLANVIGTTGASMVLIRPFIRLNKSRIKPFHIVFFIFIVSNVGGSLTPIGDPPLFLGFLKGVPFFWTLQQAAPYWAFAVIILSAIFFVLDTRSLRKEGANAADSQVANSVRISGSHNILFLGLICGFVFLDPNVIDMPSWAYVAFDGGKMSYLREVLMILTLLVGYRLSSKSALQGNEFTFEPIREVAFLFIGIFATMMPALDLIRGFAQSDTGAKLITTDTLYWGTGVFSGILDNAPTYLNFLSAGMGKYGLNIADKADVIIFLSRPEPMLLAISIASVFFGAMSYIGNAPNFMVKSIAEQNGVKMPSFIGYIIRYSLVYLLPVLILTHFLIKLLTAS